jgi:hypothetical protein
MDFNNENVPGSPIEFVEVSPIPPETNLPPSLILFIGQN